MFGGEGIQPDLLQEQVAVLGRGRSGDPDTDRRDIQNEAERVREGRKLPQFDQLGDVFLLARPAALGPAVGVVYAEVVERGPGAGEPRPAVITC